MPNSEDVIVNIEGLDIVVTGLKKTLKIGIGLSIGGDVSPEFLTMLFTRFIEWKKKYIVTILIDTVMPIDLSRNNVVDAAKQQNCDYLFFIDSDVLIEQGQLERLLSYEKDAITGVYYQKMPPYVPLPRRLVAESLYTPIEFEGNDIVEIDGTGMGCFLIKMDIFDKIHYPWFEFKYHKKDGKWGQLSEDLYLCQKIQSIGTKIYCDPTVECTHIGMSLTPEFSHIYREFRKDSKKERDITIAELSEFTCISQQDIYNKWNIATELIAKEYNEYMSQDHHNPKDFYKINKNYIFDLTNWHMHKRRGFDTDLVTSIKHNHHFTKKVLDFGSGCGQNAIEIAKEGYDVAITDYDSYTSQFARFRIKKRGLNIKFYDIEKPINDKFDIILAFDVIEHIPDNEFEKTIELLKSLRTDQGKILTTISFGTQGGIHPMHFEESPEKLKLIEELKEQNIIGGI